MTTPNKLNEFNHAEDSARRLLEKLGWTYVPREALAAERSGEREVLLKGQLRAALLRLNEWLTGEQAERVIFELEHVNEVGIARNQKLHEYLTFGLPLTVNATHGQDSRNVRFFDFDHPEGGCQGRRQNIPVGRSKSVPPERSLASVNVRASCSGEVSQRQAGSRLGG